MIIIIIIIICAIRRFMFISVNRNRRSQSMFTILMFTTCFFLLEPQLWSDTGAPDDRFPTLAAMYRTPIYHSVSCDGEWKTSRCIHNAYFSRTLLILQHIDQRRSFWPFVRVLSKTKETKIIYFTVKIGLRPECGNRKTVGVSSHAQRDWNKSEPPPDTHYEMKN